MTDRSEEKNMRRDTLAAGGSVRSAGFGGTLWLIGWLFTVGFARLVWWKILLAVVAWPYFLGSALR